MRKQQLAVEIAAKKKAVEIEREISERKNQLLVLEQEKQLKVLEVQADTLNKMSMDGSDDDEEVVCRRVVIDTDNVENYDVGSPTSKSLMMPVTVTNEQPYSQALSAPATAVLPSTEPIVSVGELNNT